MGRVFIVYWRPLPSFPIFYLVEAILSTFQPGHTAKGRREGEEGMRIKGQEKRRTRRGTREREAQASGSFNTRTLRLDY